MNTTDKIKAILAKIWGLVPDPIKNFVLKFYSNKKVFIPVAIAFGLVFLIIILGLLFGSKGVPVIIPSKKTPVPFVIATPTASASGDILTVTKSQLKNLNNQINSLDVGQNKLKPPAIDYDISF